MFGNEGFEWIFGKVHSLLADSLYLKVLYICYPLCCGGSCCTLDQKGLMWVDKGMARVADMIGCGIRDVKDA